MDIRRSPATLERYTAPNRPEERYERREPLGGGATVAPVSLPEVALRVGDLLGA